MGNEGKQFIKFAQSDTASRGGEFITTTWGYAVPKVAEDGTTSKFSLLIVISNIGCHIWPGHSSTSFTLKGWVRASECHRYHCINCGPDWTTCNRRSRKSLCWHLKDTWHRGLCPPLPWYLHVSWYLAVWVYYCTLLCHRRSLDAFYFPHILQVKNAPFDLKLFN